MKTLGILFLLMSVTSTAHASAILKCHLAIDHYVWDKSAPLNLPSSDPYNKDPSSEGQIEEDVVITTTGKTVHVSAWGRVTETAIDSKPYTLFETGLGLTVNGMEIQDGGSFLTHRTISESIRDGLRYGASQSSYWLPNGGMNYVRCYVTNSN